MAYSSELLKLSRELLSLRVEQLEFENKALHRVVMMQYKTKKLDEMIHRIEQENPGMRLNEDFELVEKGEK